MSESERGLPTYNDLLPVDHGQTRMYEANDGDTTTTRSTMADFLPRVPVDITSFIFFYACQPTPDPFLTLGSNPRWERRFYPLWLGQVCRSWRDFAWETSELWETVVIRVRDSPVGIEAQKFLLREWLSRAKGRPLDIYLEESGDELHSDAIDPVDLLITPLVQHSQQWRTIDFHLPQKRYLFISHLGTGCVPRIRTPVRIPGSSSARNEGQTREERSIPLTLLQTASLHGEGNTALRSGDMPLNLVHASFLRELSFSSILMKSDLLCFPTKRITRLTLSLVLRIVPRELLAQLPQLNELTLSKCSVVRKLEPNAGSRPIIHENLRVLHIEVESEFLFNLIVHQLSFPALKTLSICVPEPFRYTNFLLSFIKRSECALTNLTSETVCSTADYDLIEFLSSDIISSSLKELHILDYSTVGPDTNRKRIMRRNKGLGAVSGLDRNFFDNFYPYLFPHFLPRLETLEYRGMLYVDSIDFLEPFILRSRMRDSEPGFDLDINVGQDMAILRKATIQAGTVLGKSFSIAEYPDSQYVWEVIRMVEVGVLTLLNADGTLWL